MTLIDAVDYAIRLLDEPVLNGSDRRSGASGRQGRYDLTPREREVLEMLAAGRSDGQIAEALFISKKTAAVHVGNIKGKLGASSRVEIATIALRTGLVAEP
jgi:DNA-binding CsgD family transcriptional regulator